MSFIIISKNRTYVYLKNEILLFTLENGDIVIYTGKRKYFYLQWKTEILLFILKKRTYSYLYWKSTYPCLYWKMDTLQFLRAH